ncbi:MAG TPA: NAD(P)-dependent oxidoreductase [Candidatus Dormibacteraeota bacterium]
MADLVGVLGLGNIGGGMAHRLLDSGYAVAGYDLSPAAGDRAAAMGVRISGSAPELAAAVPVLITSLPTPASVLDALLGEGGALEAMVPGATLIETSTIDPHTMERVGAAARARGLQVLDLTLSGEPPQAARGELVFMAGGDEAVLEAQRALLETLSRKLHHTGAVGTAKTVKLVNNLMSLSNIAAAAEAFVLGVKCGMEPQRLFDILSTSGGRSAHFIHDWPGVLRGDYRPGFKTSLAAKDMGLILDLAEQERYAAVLAPVLARLYRDAVEGGSGEEHFTSLVKLFESRAGVSVQPAEPAASG